MGFDVSWGKVMFFLVPIMLWLAGGAAASLRAGKSLWVGYLSGSDNRLSLSRLQAFLWTLVIFGAFAAAMFCHTKIATGSTDEITAAKAAKEVADKAAKETSDELLAKKSAQKTAENERLTAQRSETEKTDALAKATDATKAQAQADLDKAKDGMAKALAKQTQATEDANKAKEAADKASQDQKDATAKLSSYNWVTIPKELLMLAGIAIGSGIFSSLIAARSGEDKTAVIKKLILANIPTETRNKFISKTEADKNEVKAFLSQPPSLIDLNSSPPATMKANALIIAGRDFGDNGSVKINNMVGLTPLWSDEFIVFNNPPPLDEKGGNTLTVESPNGKLIHKLNLDFSLGDPIINHEFIDLFRDDKNPNQLDLMKFQMFGWTVIAIFIYIWIFISGVTSEMSELPKVDQSIVILTGLSQTGYLAGKAAGSASN
jgi:hypothetical protein